MWRKLLIALALLCSLAAHPAAAGTWVGTQLCRLTGYECRTYLGPDGVMNDGDYMIAQYSTTFYQDYAELYFTGGDLQLWAHIDPGLQCDPGAQSCDPYWTMLWHSGTSGSGAFLYVDPAGYVQIRIGNNAIWSYGGYGTQIGLYVEQLGNPGVTHGNAVIRGASSEVWPPSTAYVNLY